AESLAAQKLEIGRLAARGLTNGSGKGMTMTMPALGGAEWLNSEPLTRDGLRGQVVLVDCWTLT
ncbi:MAG: cytochrome c biogenesis protein DipZ, partial [Thermoleophilaceae bacterium]